SVTSMEIVNALEEKRLTAILSRLVPTLASDDTVDAVFSDDEAEKLISVLGITRADLNSLLSYLADVLKSAAYSITKPNQLAQQLAQSGLAETHCRAIAEVWSNSAKDIVEAFKTRSFAPKELSDINWKLGITLAQSSKANTRTPIATLDFVLRDNQTLGGPNAEHVAVEFNHDELYQFYLKLEDIQAKLDELTG
ncbi:hypothetical protein BOX15_Mlig032129g2, partial [Macrostomum lignano]